MICLGLAPQRGSCRTGASGWLRGQDLNSDLRVMGGILQGQQTTAADKSQRNQRGKGIAVGWFRLLLYPVHGQLHGQFEVSCWAHEVFQAPAIRGHIHVSNRTLSLLDEAGASISQGQMRQRRIVNKWLGFRLGQRLNSTDTSSTQPSGPMQNRTGCPTIPDFVFPPERKLDQTICMSLQKKSAAWQNFASGMGTGTPAQDTAKPRLPRLHES